MIGPHEGRELDLMLAGDKKLALFHDVLPDDGVIFEDIIPEIAFEPHVSSGQIKRFSSDVVNPRNGDIVRFVCFTLPCEEWRAKYLLWFKTEFFSGRIKHSPAHDEIIGALLGYADDDIREFLDR